MASDNLTDTTLLVIKPDGVRQRLTGEILAWVKNHGFYPIAVRQLMLTPTLRESLYGTPQNSRHLDWALNGILYTLGPVHAVVLRRITQDLRADDAADQLSGTLKGHFIPNRAALQTIRGELGALNPIFNLVHSSDSAAQARADVQVLFGEDLCSLMRKPKPVPQIILSSRPVRFDVWKSVRQLLYEDSAVDLERLAQLCPNDVSDAALDRVAGILREAGTLLDAVSARRIDGVRSGALPFEAFASSSSDEWARYLCYTTVRYLELCAGFAP